MTELDRNNNGKLDDEDVDGDEVWDQPNTIDGDEPPASTLEAVDTIITFYEYETNTLIIRTVSPLRAATTYAVVLSGGMAVRQAVMLASGHLGTLRVQGATQSTQAKP